MAGIGEIRPQVPIRQPVDTRIIKPSDARQQMPRRQPNREDADKRDNNEDDHDDSFHIDEYA